MRSLEIQVFRNGAWCKVTTVSYGSAWRLDATAQRQAAIRTGLLGMADWQASDQFIGLPMRLAELAGVYGRREFVAVTGAGR